MALHVLLIVLHATLATVAFGFGCALLVVLPISARSVRFLAYYVSTLAAIALLVSVVLVDWSTLAFVQRVAFGILGLLGLYMALRTEQARRTLHHRAPGSRARFAGHVGFVLIALFDGFCIVSAIDLRLPPVVIVIVAIAGVAAGILVIRRVAKRETRADRIASVPKE